MALKIKNNKTGKEYTVSDDAWKKLQSNGDSGRYTIIQKNVPDTKTETPPATNYDTLLAQAKDAETAENWQGALDLYRQVNEINKTKKVSDKIAELEKKVTPV